MASARAVLEKVVKYFENSTDVVKIYLVKIDLTNSQAYMTADCKSDSW